jgi:hypothetical protein
LEGLIVPLSLHARFVPLLFKPFLCPAHHKPLPTASVVDPLTLSPPLQHEQSGQSENEAFANQMSPELDEFLNFFGERVRLKVERHLL